ncbi:hypothetical protein B0H11DRAFT_574900 [Mycena galericulata]|nr:hypothetical protein B0H11DRAFT_574900 [Mycena galericulata]
MSQLVSAALFILFPTSRMHSFIYRCPFEVSFSWPIVGTAFSSGRTSVSHRRFGPVLRPRHAAYPGSGFPTMQNGLRHLDDTSFHSTFIVFAVSIYPVLFFSDPVV